jgi:nucleoside-diphosphate-sugar epimerase
MKKILVTGSNGYIGNALVLALLNRKKEFTVRAAARRGSILNSKSFETVRLGSLEESPDYVEAFKKTMQDPAVIEAHKKAGMALDFKDNKELGDLIKAQDKFARDVVNDLYK